MDTSWPNEFGEGYQISVGSYGGLDDRFKRKKRKLPAGFAPPRQKSKPAPKRKPK